mmetsp:Transcript_28073/g.34666  ORF Transcript_28073/g.34666 Transcript_28073/m.34666 type:complete len:1149 (-) Transcript_28073:230-3676(-)
MVAVDYESPMKMAMLVAKDATPDSSGKEILARYRELVAQKSAERLKMQSLSLREDSEDGSISMLDSIEEDGSDSSDSFTDTNSPKNDNSCSSDGVSLPLNQSNRRDDLAKACSDDLTNAMVAEATMLGQLAKQNIRQKFQQLQNKQHNNNKGTMSTSTSISSANVNNSYSTKKTTKTPSKFQVFQDETSHNQNNNVVSHNQGQQQQQKRSILQPKSNNVLTYTNNDHKMGSGIKTQKKSVLQPKSSNVMNHKNTNDQKTNKMAKHVHNMNTSITKEKMNTISKAQTVRTVKEQSTTRESTSSTSYSPIQRNETINNVTKTMDDPIEQMKLKGNQNSSPIKKTSPSSIHASPVSTTSECTTSTSSLPNMSRIEQDESIWAMVETGTGDVHQECQNNNNNNVSGNGDNLDTESKTCSRQKRSELKIDNEELISLGMNTTCASIESETNYRNNVHEEDLINYEAIKKANFTTSADAHDDTCHDTNYSIRTPVDSVQTFSIGGRSYSFETSNVFSSMFASPKGKNIQNQGSVSDSISGVETDKSMSGDTAIPDLTFNTNVGYNYLEDKVSPISKILVTGDASNGNDTSLGLSKSAAASLIERNKTLVKEVRFADQTCVELSERNLAMKRDGQRMQNELNQLKKEKHELHEKIVKTTYNSARVEESVNSLTKQKSEQKNHYESQIHQMDESLKEVKEQNAILMQRLASTQSTAEVSAASAAETYRKFCQDAEKKIEITQKQSDERLTLYNKEKEDKLKIEMERDELKLKCSQMEELIKGGDYSSKSELKTQQSSPQTNATPNKMSTNLAPSLKNQPIRTPTSTVLARTLESELQRAHDATERIMEAEMIISVTQSELQESARQLELAKAENEDLSVQIKVLKENVSSKFSEASEFESDSGVQFDTSLEESLGTNMSIEELVSKAFNEKLTVARTECEDYKRELDAILQEIKRVQGEGLNCSTSHDGSNNYEQTIPGLLQAVRELAQVCAKQAEEIIWLKCRSKEKKEEIQKLEKEVEKRNTNIETQNIVMIDLKNEITEINVCKTEKENEINILKSEMKADAQKYQKEFEKIDMELVDQQAHSDALMINLREQDEVCKNQLQEIKTMKVNMDSLNKKLQEKEAEIMSQEKRYKGIMTDVNELATKITQIKEEY